MVQITGFVEIGSLTSDQSKLIHFKKKYLELKKYIGHTYITLTSFDVIFPNINFG